MTRGFRITLWILSSLAVLWTLIALAGFFGMSGMMGCCGTRGGSMNGWRHDGRERHHGNVDDGNDAAHDTHLGGHAGFGRRLRLSSRDLAPLASATRAIKAPPLRRSRVIAPSLRIGRGMAGRLAVE